LIFQADTDITGICLWVCEDYCWIDFVFEFWSVFSEVTRNPLADYLKIGRLKYSEEEGIMLRNMFSGISNIEYFLTKESLHVYRTKLTEEVQS